LHAALQHTPSTHSPEPHSLLSEHVAPFGFAHVPLPLTLHERPDAHDEVEQHTPSTQLPLVHCVGSVHAVPAAYCETHVADAVLQKKPAAQSLAVLVQLVLHAVAPHE
jgi:hypothetical protein